MSSKIIKGNSLNMSPSLKSPAVESKELSPVSSYETDSGETLQRTNHTVMIKSFKKLSLKETEIKNEITTNNLKF